MRIRKMGKFLLWVLPKDVKAITLYPFGMYYRLSTPIGMVNHEHIHWMQQKEMLCLFFYLWYVFEWMLKLIFKGREAYYRISFEREAYNNEGNASYLDNRRHYAWLKYVL